MNKMLPVVTFPSRPASSAAANPLITVPMDDSSCGETMRVPMTAAQVMALLASARAYKKGKLIPALALALFGGLRLCEIRRLTCKEIDFDTGKVLVGDTATANDKKARLVRLPPDAREWLRLHGGNPLMDETWMLDYRRFQDSTGLYVPSGGLRQTCVAYMLHKNGDSATTMYWTGIPTARLHRLFTTPIEAREVFVFWNLTPSSLTSADQAPELVLQSCS